MTAGRGIVHAEMPASDEPGHGLQLWINLPKEHKVGFLNWVTVIVCYKLFFYFIIKYNTLF